MDWLEAHNPMKIHWVEKWLEFHSHGQEVRLQGLTSYTIIRPQGLISKYMPWKE